MRLSLSTVDHRPSPTAFDTNPTIDSAAACLLPPVAIALCPLHLHCHRRHCPPPAVDHIARPEARPSRHLASSTWKQSEPHN